MDELYFVVYSNEDGQSSVECLTKSTLLNRLKGGYWGTAEPQLLKTGDDVDLNANEGLFIIKGSSVMPTAVKKVTEYDLP